MKKLVALLALVVLSTPALALEQVGPKKIDGSDSSGGITNAAGANVLPKSNGTNLVASSVSDDGTNVSTSKPLLVPAGTGTGMASVGGILCSDAVSHTTTGTSEEILSDCLVPGATLGKALRATVLWQGAANSNSKTIRVRFGGIGGTVIVSKTTTTTSDYGVFGAFIVRTGAATQAAFGSYSSGSGSVVSISTPTQTLSGDVHLVVTGTTATQAGDVTALFSLVEVIN